MAKGYEINEKDIDSILNWLKVEDPANATPEMAIAMLEDLQTTFHIMGHLDPEKLKEVYCKLKKSKKSIN